MNVLTGLPARLRASALSTPVLARIGGVAAVMLGAALPLIRFGGWEIDDTNLGLIRAPWQLAHASLGAWNPNGFGFDQTHSQALLFPVNVTFGLMQSLNVPAGDRTQLWLGLLQVTAGAGMWWFLGGWFDRSSAWNVGVAATAGVGYMLSSFVIVLSTDTTMLLLPYATLPWLLGITLRAAMGRMRPLRAVALLALVLCATSAMDLPLLLIDVIATMAFGIAVVGQQARRRQAVLLLAGVGLGFAALLWTVGPTVWSAHVDPSQATANLSAESAAMYDAHTSPTEVSRLQGFWALYSGYADRPYRPYQSYYLRSIVGRGIGYWLVGLAVVGVALRRRHRVTIVLAILGVVAWRLVIGVFPAPLPPGSPALFQWAFAHVPLASTFRDTFKFMTLLTLAVVALAAAGIAVWDADKRLRHGRAVRTIGLCVLVLAVVGTAEPVWGGQLWWPDKGTQRMPAYWQNTASWLNARPEPPSERVLLLPDMPFPVYDWGMPPTEPAATLVHRWNVVQVPGTQSVYGQKEITALFHALQAVPHGGGPELTRLLTAARIRYLLVRGDMRTGYYPGIPPAAQTEQWLGEVPGVRRVASFGPLVVYRVDGTLASLVGCTDATAAMCTTGVASNGAGTSFQVALTDTVTPRVVSLDEAYGRGWMAVGSAGDRRTALRHVVVDGFANGWKVPGWVRRVIIVYEPASVLTPARAVSVVAVAVALFLLIIDLRRARRQRTTDSSSASDGVTAIPDLERVAEA
jgi:arabinofuranan 3-O-arabinosyltransferase